MRKTILIASIFLASCIPTRNLEYMEFQNNMRILKEKYPNSYILPVRGYTYFFHRSDSNGVYTVNMRRDTIVTDTLLIYSKIK